MLFRLHFRPTVPGIQKSVNLSHIYMKAGRRIRGPWFKTSSSKKYFIKCDAKKKIFFFVARYFFQRKVGQGGKVRQFLDLSNNISDFFLSN